MTYDEIPKPAVPYRSREGLIFGVCRGLADHFDLPVLWVRIGFVVAFIMTSFWPAGIAYLLLALIMKPEPVLPLKGLEDAEFYHSYATSRGMALQRLKRSFDNLDRRIQRIEAIVTEKEFDWDRRLQHENPEEN
jgi:phage shock protein C